MLGALTEAAAAFDRDDWMAAARDERPLPARASCAAPTAASSARGARPISPTPRTTPRCSKRSCTLAELDDVAWLADARAVADELLRLFHDADGGGFFTTGTDAEQLVVRPKDLFDDATPSANSLAANGLLRLARAHRRRPRYEEPAVAVLRDARAAGGVAPERLRAPARRARAVRDAARSRSRSSATPTTRGRARLRREVTGRLLPASVTLTGSPPPIASPLLAGREARGGAPTAYVCEHYACRQPVTEPDEPCARSSTRCWRVGERRLSRRRGRSRPPAPRRRPSRTRSSPGRGPRRACRPARRSSRHRSPSPGSCRAPARHGGLRPFTATLNSRSSKWPSLPKRFASRRPHARSSPFGV